MTRTREMEQDPEKPEVDRFLCTLERPARNEYSIEIERRAIELLRTRAHNEWRSRIGAEAIAEVTLKANAKLAADLVYVRKANAWMVAILAILIGIVALILWRPPKLPDNGSSFSTFEQTRRL